MGTWCTEGVKRSIREHRREEYERERKIADKRAEQYTKKLEAEIKRLKKALDIAKVKLEAIKIRAKDRSPMGGRGDKPIWVIAKNGIEEFEQALKVINEQ